MPCPASELPRPRIVFFDAGGTLLRVEPGVGAIYAEIARHHGRELDAGRLDAAFRGRLGEVQKAFRERRGLAYGRTEAEALEFWGELIRAAISDLGEGAWAASEAFGDYVAELYAAFESPGRWRAEPTAREALEALRANGVRTGVVSNWDVRLEPLLEALGLRGLFDAWGASCALGFEKPDPRLFLRAAEAAGFEPPECWHVGDSLSLDCLPAKEAGFGAALLYDPKGQAGEACPFPRLGTLREAAGLALSEPA